MSQNIINRLIDATIMHKKTHDLKFCVASVLFASTTKQIGSIHFNASRMSCRGKICPSIHSEVNTIVSHFGKDICFSPKYGWNRCCQSHPSNIKKGTKLNMMVIRLDNNNNLVNARPCYNCSKLMKSIGINKIYYSVDNKIICERVSHITTLQISSVVRLSEHVQYNAPLDISDYYTRIINQMPQEIKYDNLQYFIKYNLLCQRKVLYYTLNKDNIDILNSNNKKLGNFRFS